MRSLSTFLAHVSDQYALEPVYIVTVEWGGSFGTRQYSTHAYTGIEPLLVTVSNLSSERRVESFGYIESCEVVLRDLDADLRDYIRQNTVKDIPLTISIMMAEDDPANAEVLYVGTVSQTIRWVESERSCTLSTVAKITDIYVGTVLTYDMMTTSPLSNITNLDPAAEGKCLPLTLGACTNVPALKITKERTALTGSSVNIVSEYYVEPEDPEMPIVENSEYVLVHPQEEDELPFGVASVDDLFAINHLEMDGCVIGAAYSGMENGAYRFEINSNYNLGINAEKYGQGQGDVVLTGPRDVDDPDYSNAKVFWLASYGYNLVGQMCVIEDDMHYMWGRCTDQQGRKCVFENIWTKRTQIISEQGGTFHIIREKAVVEEGCKLLRVSTFEEKNNFSRPYYYTAASETTRVIPAGTLVRIWNTTLPYKLPGDVYITSSIGADIVGVAAEITNLETNREMLLQLPYNSYTPANSLYTITKNWGGLGWTVVTTKVPLATVPEFFKQDTLYITQRSDTGFTNLDGSSNNEDDWGSVTDLCTYLITEYTSYTVGDSFENSKEALLPYPVSFTLFEQKLLSTLLSDIAWQSMFVLTLSGTEVNMHYLAEAPTPTFTLTSDHILPGSFVISASSDSELWAYLKATWQEDYYTRQHTLIQSVEKDYPGSVHKDVDFYTLNRRVCVERAARFWFARHSNTWKRISIRTTLDALCLEAFDTCTVAMDEYLYNMIGYEGSDLFGTVLMSTFADNEISLELELPLKTGELVISDDYYLQPVENVSTNPASADRKTQTKPPVRRKGGYLHELADVNRRLRRDETGEYRDMDTPVDGDVLAYDAASDSFIMQPAPVGTGGTGANWQYIWNEQ